MIVRILSEGQFEVDDNVVDELNALDDQLVVHLDAGDEAAFRGTLEQLLSRVRDCPPVPDDQLTPSELILPDSDSSLDEVRAMVSGDGLVPG